MVLATAGLLVSVCMFHEPSWPRIEFHGHRSRAGVEYRLTAVIVRSYCHQLRASAARQAARRGRGRRQRRSPARVGVVTRSV